MLKTKRKPWYQQTNRLNHNQIKELSNKNSSKLYSQIHTHTQTHTLENLIHTSYICKIYEWEEQIQPHYLSESFYRKINSKSVSSSKACKRKGVKDLSRLSRHLKSNGNYFLEQE